MSFVRSITRSVLPLSLLCVGFVASAAWITARDAQAATTVNEELEQTMRQINGAGKMLGRGITKDNRDESLQQIDKMLHGLMAARAMTPDSVAGVAADKREEFLADYRKHLLEALKVACDVEIAILDGKYDAAQELLKTQLTAIKKAGHDKFQVE